MLLFDPTPATIIALASIFLFALPFHEFSHALAAYRLGDSTAKLMGRLTLNPLRHLDPIGGLMILMVGFGWAKPTPVNPYNLGGGRFGDAIVSFAGPVSNLVLAIAAAIPLRYILATEMAVPDLVIDALWIFVFLNLLLMVFNLLPIPPLDGSKVMFALMNPLTERRWRPTLEQYGFLILLAAVFLPIFGGQSLVRLVVSSVVDPLARLLVGL